MDSLEDPKHLIKRLSGNTEAIVLHVQRDVLFRLAIARRFVEWQIADFDFTLALRVEIIQRVADQVGEYLFQRGRIANHARQFLTGEAGASLMDGDR